MYHFITYKAFIADTDLLNIIQALKWIYVHFTAEGRKSQKHSFNLYNAIKIEANQGHRLKALDVNLKKLSSI